MYGKQLDAPLEEVTEMITILKAIQKEQRELLLLTQRARVMCPNLTEEVNSDLYRLINYSAPAPYFDCDSTLKRAFEQLSVYKKELQEKGEL